MIERIVAITSESHVYGFDGVSTTLSYTLFYYYNGPLIYNNFTRMSFAQQKELISQRLKEFANNEKILSEDLQMLSRANDLSDLEFFFEYAKIDTTEDNYYLVPKVTE